MPAPLLRVSNLVKRFPVAGSRASVHAVTDVSFDLVRGETFGLVGETGSGKTTVGRCVLRLVEATSGEIEFEGQPITRLKGRRLRDLRPRLQMVFQEPYQSLNPRMTAGETILEPLAVQGWKTDRWRREKVVSIIHRVRLDEEYLYRYPHEMSGGEQQRVGIGRAIATDPQIVVLDEPISMLDLSVRAEIIDLLVELQETLGLSYIYISHDLSTVEKICHRVAVMYLGRIVEMGPTAEVFNSPRHPYSRALLSSVLTPDPNVKRSRYMLAGEIPSPIDIPPGCPLASRCPEARPACRTRPPRLVPVAESHLMDCILADAA